jgi:hypothetical protein
MVNVFWFDRRGGFVNGCIVDADVDDEVGDDSCSDVGADSGVVISWEKSSFEAGIRFHP